MNLANQTVTCRDCRETYTCTPERDYYGDPDEPGPRSPTEGRCWDCMLAGDGLPPQPEPAAPEPVWMDPLPKRTPGGPAGLPARPGGPGANQAPDGTCRDCGRRPCAPDCLYAWWLA